MAGVSMKLHRDHYGGPLAVNKLAYFLPKGHSICNLEAITIIGNQKNEDNYPVIPVYPVKR
jgi:hypothetical protein